MPQDQAGAVSLQALRSKKPLIAAVNGVAVGVGVTMILPFDFIFASEKAKFGFIFTQRGITPEGGSTYFLPRLVWMRTALDLLISGRIFDAQEAFERVGRCL